MNEEINNKITKEEEKRYEELCQMAFNMARSDECEELEKMIKYQHAYNASSRYVNVISEMLEHIVTALGS